MFLDLRKWQHWVDHMKKENSMAEDRRARKIH